MLLWTIIASAFQSLWANKLRSLLAMLGIIIGVGAVIAMLALGAGAQAQVTAQFQALGTNLLTLRPAQRSVQGVVVGNYQNMTVDDAVAITQLPEVAFVAPVARNSVQAQYLNHNTRANVVGTSSSYFDVQNFEIDQGRRFNTAESEQLGRGRVAVMGANAATNLFGAEDPIGEIIKLKGINFKVIGVLKAKGDSGFNTDDQIFVPYPVVMKLFTGNDFLDEIDILVVDGGDMTAVSGQPAGTGANFRWGGSGTVHTVPPPPDSITALIRQRHKLLSLADADDFFIQNRADILARVSASITTFRFLLGGIAAISLLVGGIGIMNIMLVTVTERTREIGTRKAIGAKNRDVLSQFLVESLFMSGMGGAIGALAGVGMAFALPMIPALANFPPPVVQVWVIIMSVGVSGFVGIFFGLYPAYRASRLDPIEALRYE